MKIKMKDGSIKEAAFERIPYMIIVGEKEVETNSVSVRKRDDGDLGSMAINQLLEILRKEGTVSCFSCVSRLQNAKAIDCKPCLYSILGKKEVVSLLKKEMCYKNLYIWRKFRDDNKRS